MRLPRGDTTALSRSGRALSWRGLLWGSAEGGMWSSPFPPSWPISRSAPRSRRPSALPLQRMNFRTRSTFWPIGNLGCCPVNPLVLVAIGGAEVLRIALPGPAADHPPSTITNRLHTTVAWVPSIAVDPAVFGPLPDVAMDVVKTPWVRPRNCRPTSGAVETNP
jgi:hypothetical protein